MRFDLARLPNNIATLHQIIVSQAADMASERDARAAREAELAAAKAGLVAKTLEIEKLKLQIARLQRAVRPIIGEDRAGDLSARAQAGGAGDGDAIHTRGAGCIRPR